MIKNATMPILGRIAAAAVSLALILSLAPAAALAQAPQSPDGDVPLVAQADVIAQGQSGSCSWSIDNAGILTVRPSSGKGGTLASFESGAPWAPHAGRITAVVIAPGVAGGASLSGMFAGCKSLTGIDMSGLSTTGVRDMSKMFLDCSSLPSINLAGFDTSSVTNMSGMFDGCSSLIALDVSRFSTAQVTDMSGMFRACAKLETLNVSNLNTSNVVTMADMFSGCSSLYTLDVSRFDTSKVQNMQRMFATLSVATLDLSSFRTESLTDMWGMFLGSSGIETLNLAGFDTSRVTSMGMLFDGCTSLNRVILGGMFAFDGDTSELPNGEWVSANTGKVFSAHQIATERNNVVDAYVKSRPATPAPVILVGAETAWTKGATKGAMFRSSAPLADFVCVRIDGGVVDASNYEKTGTTQVTTIVLSPDYLYGLSVGSHDIDIVSATGTAKTWFTIDDDPDKLVPIDMYRLYNPNSGEHFYTADAYERGVLIELGWNNEGVGWVAPKAGDEVYRLYNAVGGEHHYTLSSEERDALQELGWSYEGVGWRSSGSVPLYRQYNPNEFANNHNYSPDENEKSTLLGLGWRDEGVAWYGLDYGRN